eukprot:366096-Pelagomonas_calceolata.AAC.5
MLQVLQVYLPGRACVAAGAAASESLAWYRSSMIIDGQYVWAGKAVGTAKVHLVWCGLPVPLAMVSLFWQARGVKRGCKIVRCIPLKVATTTGHKCQGYRKGLCRRTLPSHKRAVCSPAQPSPMSEHGLQFTALQSDAIQHQISGRFLQLVGNSEAAAELKAS